MAEFPVAHFATTVATVLSCLALLFCCYSIPNIVTDINSMWLELDTDMAEFRTQSNELSSEMMKLAPRGPNHRAQREAVNFHIRQSKGGIPETFGQAAKKPSAENADGSISEEGGSDGVLPQPATSKKFAIPAGPDVFFEPQGNILALEQVQRAAANPLLTLVPGSQSELSAGVEFLSAVRQPAVFAPLSSPGFLPVPLRPPPLPLPSLPPLPFRSPLSSFHPPQSDLCNCNPLNLCPPGPPGDPGFPGELGIDGIPGIDGKPGTDAPDVVVTIEETECYICPAGPAGPQGPNGRRGFRGPRGPRGQPGRPGRNSSPGSPGEMGVRGKPGRTGNQGLQGPPGESAQQPVGVPGSPGLPGEHGPIGHQGQPGKPAPDGLPGIQGSPGVTGQPGMPGKPGEFGPEGYEGEPGADAHYCSCPKRPVPSIPSLYEPEPLPQPDFAPPGILPLPPGYTAALGTQPQHPVDFAPPGILPLPPGFGAPAQQLQPAVDFDALGGQPVPSHFPVGSPPKPAAGSQTYPSGLPVEQPLPSQFDLQPRGQPRPPVEFSAVGSQPLPSGFPIGPQQQAQPPRDTAWVPPQGPGLVQHPSEFVVGPKPFVEISRPAAEAPQHPPQFIAGPNSETQLGGQSQHPQQKYIDVVIPGVPPPYPPGFPAP